MKQMLSFLITIIAGMSTLLGYLFIYVKKDEEKIIKYSLAFASGVMLCVSIYDLIPESINLLNNELSKNSSFLMLFLSILIGIFIPIIVDKIIKNKDNLLYRVGVLSMIAIIIHNIPEGIATYLSALTNVRLGLTIAIAITLHNIPEGVSIAIPIYYSTLNKKKAFIMTFVSALSEPFGAFLAHVFLKNIITNQNMGIILGVIAGIMTYIAIIELLPNALKYEKRKKTIIFFLTGILFMYISIKLLRY